MTHFSTLLNEYIQKIDCSGADLAARADLSAAAISRYRSGERAPKRNSEIIDKLAKGICSLAGEKQFQWSEDDICGALNNALTSPEKGG